MVRNELYQMHRIGSSFLVRKWDVPFTNPGVTDTTQAGWNAACRQSALITGEGAQTTELKALPLRLALGEKTHTTHTLGRTLPKHLHGQPSLRPG